MRQLETVTIIIILIIHIVTDGMLVAEYMN